MLIEKGSQRPKRPSRFSLTDMLGRRLGWGAAAVVRMASSSSSIPALPRLFIPPCRAHHEAAMAASLSTSQTLRNGGGRQMQVVISYPELVLLSSSTTPFVESKSLLFLVLVSGLAVEGPCDAEVG